MAHLRVVAFVATAALAFAGCDDDGDASPGGDADAADVATSDAADSDAPDSDAADVPDVDPWEGFEGVRIDLTPYRDETGTGAVVRVATEDDLIDGQMQMGRAGDHYLANDRIHAIVRGADRHMGAAPWGGNIIAADLIRAEGEPERNAWGALSMLINFGRTLLPETYDIIYDGSSGGAVLAVTGRDTINDFLNVPILLEQELGDQARLTLNPEEDAHLTITQYYVLNPGSQRIRVVAALRNDGDGDRIVAAGELVDPGGDTILFNPVRRDAKFGAPSQPVPEPADAYLAWIAEDVAYGYAPRMEGQPTLAMTVSGVTGTVVGARNLFDFTGDEPLDPEALPAGAVLLAPGEVYVVARDFYVGRDLAAIDAAWHADSGRGLGALTGTVELSDVPEGTRVAAFDEDDDLLTVFTVEADGSFGGRLPPGTYTLRADAPGHPYSEATSVTIEDGGATTTTVMAPGAVLVTVTVQTPDGSPSPAKVSFVCEGPCPKDLIDGGRYFRNSTRDRLPPTVQEVGFVGPSGEATFRVPPGDYRVVVSRGNEFSVWPNGWPSEPGPAFSWEAGDTETVEAEIARVLDTTGWISGDLHVHGINSVDSFVHHERRILSFLAEGVDVLVSTDHEFVTDWAPYVADLEAESLIVTLIGDELTTFDWGHFNTYPIEINPESRTGAYIDWGNGEGPTFNPTQLFEAMAEVPSPVAEPVIQVNHPRGSLGYFTAIGLDTATFATASDPSIFRMEPPVGSEIGVDTRLFDTSFTAMEIYNGWSIGAFNTRLNDWFAFLQRGLIVTAVAVSDTHVEFSDAVGSPRSWIAVGSEHETPNTFDTELFAAGINDGRLIGSNGPFVRVEAVSGENGAGPGELLSLENADDDVALEISVEVPSWFGIDAIEVYANIAGTDSRPFEQQSNPPAPTHVIAVDLSQESTVPGVSVAEDAETPHRRWVIERSQSVEPTVDTWYVVMVRGSTSGFPVLLEGISALAFTNAILVDVDGDGTFNAPAAVERRPVGNVTRPVRTVLDRPLTDDDLGRAFEAHDEHR